MSDVILNSITRPVGFLLSIEQFERSLFDAATVAALSLSIFAASGYIAGDRAAAQEANQIGESIAAAQPVGNSLPVSHSAADLTSPPESPMEIQLDGVWSFDCLTTAAPEWRRHCSSMGPSNTSLFNVLPSDQQIGQFNLQQPLLTPQDRDSILRLPLQPYPDRLMVEIEL